MCLRSSLPVSCGFPPSIIYIFHLFIFCIFSLHAPQWPLVPCFKSICNFLISVTTSNLFCALLIFATKKGWSVLDAVPSLNTDFIFNLLLSDFFTHYHRGCSVIINELDSLHLKISSQIFFLKCFIALSVLTYPLLTTFLFFFCF